MKQFEVNVSKMCYASVIVEAETPEQAEEKALQMWGRGEISLADDDECQLPLTLTEEIG